MELSFSPLIYLAIFGAVLLLIQAIYLLAFGRRMEHDSKMNRRLSMMEKGQSKRDVMERLRKERNTHLGKGLALPLYGLLESHARKGNIAFTPTTLMLLMVSLSGFSMGLLTLATETPLAVRIAMGTAFGVGGVYFWVAGKSRKRVSAIEEQLPEAIELIIRSLRVGHPFGAALTIASEESQDPLATELGLIADEIAYGRDAGEAISDFAERMDMHDLRFLATAVSIQQKSGGNLAEILEGLSKVIRARFKLFRRVNAITAEAKWSGMFLSGFPIVAMIGIQIIKPDYYDNVKETPLFIPAAIVVCGFLIINILYMRKMTQIKV